MIKLVDQLSPMGNFAVATATDIVCSDNERLQDKIDNGTLGGDTSQTLTEAEYLALPEEEKLNNSYYLYDIGVHYKNGVAYSRKEPIPLTMEEYKALGEVDPDQEYIVSADAEGILLGAEDIGYNNAESGIQATTVQGAIDKVVKTVEDKVDKTDITTTINSTSTNTQVPSAKAVWNKSKNNIQPLLNGVDIIVYADSISNEMVTDTVRIMSATNSPYGVDNVDNDFYYTIYNINDDKFKRILAYDIRKNDMYMIMKNNNIWGTWQKIATMDKVESKYEEATLDTPVDWNTLNTKARYYVSGGAIMTNAPMQQPFGELVVETAGDGSVCRVQKFFSFDGRLYMRRWTGSIWNEWYKFDGTAN